MISYELSYATSLAAVVLLAGSLSVREIVDAQAGTWFGFSRTGSSSCSRSASSSTPSPVSPKPTARRSIFPRRSRNWSPATTPNTARCGSRCSPQPDTSTWRRCRPWRPTCIWAAGTACRSMPPTLSSIGWMAGFLAKVGGFLFFYIWMRWTLPRYRYDQLMQFGWKFLLPASVVNLIATAACGCISMPETTASSTSFAGTGDPRLALVIGQRNPMYSVLLLVLSFGGPGRPVRAARCAVPRAWRRSSSTPARSWCCSCSSSCC